VALAGWLTRARRYTGRTTRPSDIGAGGFVTRHQLSVFPLRVEYTLTPSGQDVTAKLLELIAQVEASMDSVLASRQHYDCNAAAGHAART
jgi:hypothetical protein